MHAYDLKTSSRKHANKHTIRPQLTDSVIRKVSGSRAKLLDHGRRSLTHGQVLSTTGVDSPGTDRVSSTRARFTEFGQVFSVADKLSVGQPYILSLAFKNENGQR